MKMSTKLQFSTVLFFQFISLSLFSNSTTLFSLYCPDDVVVSCTDELWDLSQYGDAYVQTYSGPQSAGTPEVTYNLSTCNTGYIYRTWTVEDYNWNLISCTQTITVQSNGGFGVDNITWPGELLELEGCNPDLDPHNLPEGYGFPSYDWTECSMVGVSYSDKTFYISPTCSKVVRKWQVMDWCQYDSNYNTGLWVYYQTIKISSSDIPDPDFPEDMQFNSYNCKDALVDIEPLTIDENSCGGDFLITNDSPYAYDSGNNISGVYPIGITKVKITVYYGCGKKKVKIVTIKVENKKAPNVYCYGEMITALMPVDADNDGFPEDGMVEIWAKDLDKGSTSSCNGGPVTFSFSEDIDDTFKVFTCNDVGENEVQMWVTDSKGAQSYCVVKLIIQNNSANIPDCEPPVEMPEDSISLYGRVSNLFNYKIENVNINILELNTTYDIITTIDTSYELVENIITTSSGTELTVWYYDSIFTTKYDTINSPQTMHKSSDLNGYFAFDSCMIKGKDYMVSAGYDDETKRGLDIRDVIILEKYLNQEIDFASDYIREAADVNLDGIIDEQDLSVLTAFINGEIERLNDVKSWNFYAINVSNEEESEEFIYLNNLDNVLQQVNFVGAKIGDLNADAFTIYDIAQDEFRNGLVIEKNNDISINPNPFNSYINIDINVDETSRIDIQFFDVAGRLLKNYNKNVEKGGNQIHLELIHDYKGIVFYQIIENGIQIKNGRLIKL